MERDLDGSPEETRIRRNGLSRNGLVISDHLLEDRLSPLRYISNLTMVIVDMYARNYNKLCFDPQKLMRMNPKTGSVERYFSHPCTANWWNSAYDFARSLHPNRTVRLLPVVLYSDATTADDNETHHSVYMSLANFNLDDFTSLHGKEVVALLPHLKKPVDLNDTTTARYRTALFQACMSELTKPFADIHQKVHIAEIPILLLINSFTFFFLQGIFVRNPESGDLEVLVPMLGFWKSDHPEAEQVCMQYKVERFCAYIATAVLLSILLARTKRLHSLLRSDASNERLQLPCSSACA